jgi:putative DNA primase/helicase
MGIAKDHLDESQRRSIAEGCFTVQTGWEASEMTGLCPFHDDKKASFSYNPEKDLYHCLTPSCGQSGDLADLWARVHGYTETKEGFKAFCKEFNINQDPAAAGSGSGHEHPTPAPAPRKKKKAGNSDTSGGSSSKSKDDSDPPPLDEVFASLKPLPENWIAYLKQTRGWSREIIEKIDIRLQTAYQAKKTGEIKQIKRPERLAISIRDRQGHVRNIRLYKPGGLREGEHKIFSWGTDYGAARLFPAEPDGRSPVFLCEGEPDTICALSLGLNAITQTSKPKKWSRDHAKVFENRDVVLVMDADQAGQHYGNDFAAPALCKVARSIKILEWPDFMGRELDGTWPADHGQDLTDFFVKHKKTLDDFWPLVENAPVVNTLEHISEQAREFFTKNFNDRLVFRPRLVAEKILEKYQVLSDPGSGMIYRWNGRYWQAYHEDHIKAACVRLLGLEAQRSRIEDAVYQVKSMATLPDGRAVNDHKDIVCLKNGMLDLATWKLFPHDPKYYATFELAVTFDPKSTRKCDRWLSYLSQTVQTPAVIRQVQEFFGFCLTKDVAWAKSMFLVGPGSDGKSVMLKILRDMVGPENTSSVSFNELENQFLRASLYQKAVNFSTETQSMAIESEYFKKISAGDPINAAFKHKDSFEFVPFCKLVFSANRLPRVLDNSDGFYRRVLPIQFKRQFKEDDPDTDPWLYEKLRAELSEIFVWSLVGLARLIEQGRFTDCQETQETLLGYKRLNNPVLCFVDDMCLFDQSYEIPKKDLYSKYRDYCAGGGYKTFSRENFFRELYAAKSDLQLIRPRVQGKREYYVKGIAIRDEA